MGNASPTSSCVSLHPMRLPQPWEGWRIPLSGFPTPEPELAPVRTFLNRLSEVLAAKGGLSTEVLIQFGQLHCGDGSDRFATHCHQWNPRMGLGVWPDRPSPALWKPEDFENLPLGRSPRSLRNQVFLISGPPEARDAARNVMLGLGTVLQILTSQDTEALLSTTRELLLPAIQEPAFRSYSFFVPLLDRASIESAASSRLEAWLCGAPVYMRESVEDQGILLVSREGLGATLRELRY